MWCKSTATRPEKTLNLLRFSQRYHDPRVIHRCNSRVSRLTDKAVQPYHTRPVYPFLKRYQTCGSINQSINQAIKQASNTAYRNVLLDQLALRVFASLALIGHVGERKSHSKLTWPEETNVQRRLSPPQMLLCRSREALSFPVSLLDENVLSPDTLVPPLL